jgi:hypothetical protein
MAQPLYCWRCEMVLPMLDEEEWARLEPLLVASIESIQRYRRQHGVSLDDVPIPKMYWSALSMFQKITGVAEIKPQALWHHRRSNLGADCIHCGKPLRTPQANLCAACGEPRA